MDFIDPSKNGTEGRKISTKAAGNNDLCSRFIEIPSKTSTKSVKNAVNALN